MTAVLVAALQGARTIVLPAGTPTTFGTAVPLVVSPGVYRVRVVGGAVVLNDGSPFSDDDLRVTELDELDDLYLPNGKVQFAAAGATASRAWLLRKHIVEVK